MRTKPYPILAQTLVLKLGRGQMARAPAIRTRAIGASSADVRAECRCVANAAGCVGDSLVVEATTARMKIAVTRTPIKCYAAKTGLKMDFVYQRYIVVYRSINEISLQLRYPAKTVSRFAKSGHLYII